MNIVHNIKYSHKICNEKECDNDEFKVMDGNVLFATFCCKKGFEKSLYEDIEKTD